MLPRARRLCTKAAPARNVRSCHRQSHVKLFTRQLGGTLACRLNGRVYYSTMNARVLLVVGQDRLRLRESVEFQWFLIELSVLQHPSMRNCEQPTTPRCTSWQQVGVNKLHHLPLTHIQEYRFRLCISAQPAGLTYEGERRITQGKKQYLPGRNLAISVHLLPRHFCALHIARSSSGVHGSRLMVGSSWFLKRSRHCLPLRPGSCAAMTAHFRRP